MKIRHKKLIASGIALSLAGVLGAGALLQTSVSVQASYAMMPGIEQIVKDTSEEKPFKILEIVDNTNEAEIGYYVSGQEPYVKLYEYKYTDSDEQEQTMKFQSLEEGLSKLPTSELRKEFADGTQTTNIKQIQNVCYKSGGEGQDSDYPLSYSEYREKYILSPDEKATGSWENDWKKIDFTDSTGKSKSYKVQVKGNYQENTAGTGDYTKKEQQYYPIRQGTDDAQNKNEKVRENIQNFYYTGSEEANSPYFLNFEPVNNAELNTNFNNNGEKLDNNRILQDYNYAEGNYGYYENVYEDLTEEIVQNLTVRVFKFPGENPSVDLNGAKKLLDTSVKNGTAFSSGEDEFMSVDDTTDQTQATQQDSVPQVPQAEEGNADAAFSDGDFTSGPDAAETEDSFDSTGTGADPQESATPDNNVSADANTVSEAATGTESSGNNVESNPLIPYVSNQNKDGTKVDPTSDPSNPLVYYGETIEQYPFYKYTMISNLKAVKEQADKNTTAIQNGTFNLNLNAVSLTDSSNRKCNVTLEDGQYWFWVWDGNNVDGAIKYPVSIVTCRQPVSYNDVHKIPTELGIGNYYYKVSAVYFCCKKDEPAAAEDTHAYKYYGWYSPSYADESNPYIHVDDADRNQATYYVSDAEYELTPGTGNYDFIPDDNATEQPVEVDHMYYQGGYTNHDWFKQYVFHLEPGEAGSDERKQFDAFKIEVTTITADDFNKKYGSAEKTASAASGDSDATEITGDGDSTDSDHSSADDSVNSDDTQAGNSQTDDIQSDDVQTDNTSDDQNTDTQDTNETQSEDQAAAQNEGDTSEVDPMVSEAGVELVSIEKELTEATDDSTSIDEFQDGTSVDPQTTEDSAQITNNISDEADASSQFTDNSADVIDDNGAFSAGDTVASNTSGKLAEYGLIYVNSSDINQAAAKKMSNIPTIINAAKLTGNSTTAQSFAAYIKGTDQDADGHYVNTLVYVFKNTFAETNESTHQSDLINVNFHTNFNPDASGDSGSTASEKAIQGFEEILEYIESENKYRKLGQTTDSSGISDGSDEVSDGETVTPTPANAKIPLLKKDISQARIIEYIINYNYKRQTKLKSTINVLDIEPAKVDDSQKLQPSMVESWLGYGITTTTGCENSGNPVNNMFDGNSNTYWHSNWGSGNCQNKNQLHHIDVTFGKTVTLRGFKYVPRSGNSINGVFVKVKVYFYTQPECTGEELNKGGTEVTNTNGFNKVDWIYNFAQSYSNVRSVKIEIVEAGDDTVSHQEHYHKSSRLASCAELSFITDMPEVKITTMTAAEFVGHIDDIGSKYDMIYIGDQTNSDPNTNLLTGSNGLCYAHVGAVRGPASSSNTNLLKLLGQLDIDYDRNGSQTNENGKIIRRFAPIDTYSEDGAGYYRGSGNDITSQICSELKEFVQSGYPVIFASELMRNDSRSIDTSKVDSASYYYEFMEYALKYENTFSSLELQSDTTKLDFFANLAKPVINFTEKPKEPHRFNEKTGAYPDRGLIKDGQLKYVFSIKNDSDAAPAVTTYDCNLYLDLNFDGNLSDREEQSSYIQITDESGQVISSIKDDGDKTHYELRAGKTYTLTRKLPEAYFKIITWKLEISSNRNPYIHTSETGYAKQGRNGAQKQTIKVLQLQADATGNYWDLTTGKSELNDRRFQKKINDLNNAGNFDFNIQIESISVTDINSFRVTKDDHKLKEILDDGKEVLSGAAGSGGYDMLIIGFADGFNNINNDCHQVEDILDFIKSGKSVLFSHDTTSYINYDQDEMYGKIAKTQYGLDETTAIRTEKGRFIKWGLELNRYLRSVVGMDRYGITSTEIINSGTGQTLSQLLKQGNELNADQVDFNTLMKLAGDVAYQNGNRNETYAQTQAYSNEYLSTNIDTRRVTRAEKINDGAITQYPYEMGDDPITLSETHGQYYQLGLEQDRDINGNSDGKSDVVVWYTLTDKYYSNSPRDVRNNYYFYSKGNVIYTGAGHRPDNRVYLDDEKNNNEAEVNLFINAIVAAANVTAVEPKAGFVKSMNPNAGTEAVKYYMTDQTFALPDNEVNVVNNNIELYLNIKEYNMVSADLNKSDLDKQEMTIQFYIEDESGTIQENSGINKNLTDITRQIGNIKEYGGSKEGIDVGTDGMFHTKDSSVYSLKLNNIEQYLKKQNADRTYTYKNNCKVYAKVSSTVYLYNKPNTRTVWTSVDLKQRQLFDLD